MDRRTLGKLIVSLLVFIPFEGFQPDGSAFGEGMNRLENVLPVHAGHRPLQEAQPVSSVADGPVTGAMVHIFQAEATEQHAVPIGDAEPIPFDLVGSDGRTTDLWELVDKKEADDSTYVVWGGAPSAVLHAWNLEAVTDPTVDTGHVARWRYRVTGGAGAWSAVFDILAGLSTIDAGSPSGTGDTDWIELSHPLDAGEVGNIGDYANLFIRAEFTVAGSAQFGRPVSDLALNGWTNQAGSSTGVFQAIDEASASDADYAQSPPLQLAGARSKYRVALTDLVDPFVKDDLVGTYTMRYRYLVTNAGVNVKVTLGHGGTGTGGTVIVTQEHTGITPGSFIAGSLVIEDEIWAIASAAYADLWLEFEGHWPTEGSSVADQTVVPTSDVEDNGWTPSSGATLWEAIDADDGTSVTADSAASFTVAMPAVDPGLDTTHVLTVKAASATAGTSNFKVELLEGATVRFSDTFTRSSTSLSNEVIPIHPSFAASISNYANLRLRVTDQGGITSVRCKVSYAKLETAAPRRAQISWAELETPSTAQGQISLVNLSVPAVVTEYEGDKPILYAGTRTKLYKVGTEEWEDYSKSGGYAVGTEEPSGWRFAPWGAEILATNYGDPVQVLPAGGTAFEDAIDTPSPAPKARFIAPWRERLVLGDINLTGHAADEIWVSAPDDRSDFAPSASTRAGFQPVRSKPGQIMGLLGGQVGVIAKRNSLHAMYFTGTSVLYRLEDITISGEAAGVGYPSSLVGDHTDFLYHSGGNFCRGSAASGVQAIGSEQVSAFAFDGLKHFKPGSMAVEDQIMVGARCPSTGIIIWSFQGDSNDPWRHDRALLYNPVTEEWTYHTQPVDVAYLVSNPNSIDESGNLFRGILGFTWDGTDSAWYRYSGNTCYQATFRTKVRELPHDPAVRRDEQSGRFQSTAARQKRVVREVVPVISVPEGQPVPELTVQVEGFREMDHLSGYSQTETVTAVNKNSRGVYHFGPGVPGFFHRFTMVLPEGFTGLARCDGLYVLYDVGSEA